MVGSSESALSAIGSALNFTPINATRLVAAKIATLQKADGPTGVKAEAFRRTPKFHPILKLAGFGCVPVAQQFLERSWPKLSEDQRACVISGVERVFVALAK